MYVYTGTLTYQNYAHNELFTLILPRSFALGDPALAYWHWTVSHSGQRNYPTSIHGLIDSVSPSTSSSYTQTTTLTLFQTSYYHLTLTLSHPRPPRTLLMIFASEQGYSSPGAQVLTLRYADDALDLCRIYVGSLTYFDYALATSIVFVLPRGKWGTGERIQAYWQWTVDGYGVRNAVTDYQGTIDRFIEGERQVECFGEMYYMFVGAIRGEGKGERVCLTMWNKGRTYKSSEVIGRLTYGGAAEKISTPLSLPSTSTLTSTSSSTSTTNSNSTRHHSTIDTSIFLLAATFHHHSVTHPLPSPSHLPSPHQSSTPQHSQAGTWADTRHIGSGGFGSVSLQTCRCDNEYQLRAVKKLPLGMRGVDYNRELKSLTALSDREDLFIKFLGWYENEDFVFIAMEYLRHGDLAEYIQTNPVGAATNARTLTLQLLRGLDILHQRRICHRDLKPPNVLLATLDPIRVKITDFGISKQMAGTQLRTRCGTSGYIAPEIMGFLPRPSGDYTDAVDMWALGSILHELLVGMIPFAEEEEEEEEEQTMVSESVVYVRQVDSYMMHRYCSGLMAFPEGVLVQRGVSSEAMDVVKGLLVPEPEGRWGVERALASKWLVGGEGVEL